jgi:predicted MPP superfamily phosphohydrolase
LEPQWLAVRRHRVGTSHGLRIAHFTDIHHRGDEGRLRDVVDTVNRLKPDLAVFTGDMVEDARFFGPALEILTGIHCPLYGIAGNHDYWARADFRLARKAFARTGGAWLKDESAVAAGGRVRLLAVDRLPAEPLPRVGAFNLVLMHYPVWADRLGFTADLLLAGHSHGGQVRIPFYGSLVKPHDVGPYELGWYDTPSGRLYVNPGIGCLRFDVRFNCRPEVTVFEV